MSQKSQLKNFSKSVVYQSIQIFNKTHQKEPLKQKIEKSYEFKNDFFNKETSKQKNDFEEFFSRKDVKSKIEKIDDFSDAVNILSRYPSKIISERGLDTKSLFHSFIEIYVHYVGDFKYDEKKFEYIFNSFVKFLDSGFKEVHYFVPIFQLSFPSKYSQKELSKNLKLSKISPEQFKIVKESLVGNHSTPGYLRKLSYVLETTVSFQNNPEDEDNNANKIFTKFLKVIRLFLEGDVQLGPIYKNHTLWTKNYSKILNIREIKLGKKNSKLNNRIFSKLKNFYNDFSNLDLEHKDWSFIQVAIDRFSSSISRNDEVDKIVDLNVSLECLFSSAGETSLKIANRTALMMGPDENEQERCWDFIKSTYRLRNSILHGRKSIENISGDVKELERIIRISIRKFLNLSENLSKDASLKGKIKRDYILEQLDLGLINRNKLENFEKKFSGHFN